MGPSQASPCPLCGHDTDNGMDLAEFREHPGVLFHADCVYLVGVPRARRIARGTLASLILRVGRPSIHRAVRFCVSHNA